MTNVSNITTATLDPPTSNSNTDQQIYKRWHKFGFIKISFWADGNKIIIEIGQTSGDDKALQSVTKCWIPPMQFLAYLRSEVNNQLEHMNPDFAGKGLTFYGGGTTRENGIVSRVFRISYYKDRDGATNTLARTFRCAHFPGQKNAMGAIMPVKDGKAISDDSIKISITELGEIFERTLLMVYTEGINYTTDE